MSDEEKILKTLTPYANEMEDERLGTFLTLSVGRVYLKGNVAVLSKSDMRHITDWLKSSILNNASWMDNLDEKGRPKKLIKFSSIEQIVSEADKAMLKANQKLLGTKLIEGEEKLIEELEDGFYIVQLLTPAALDRESTQMQHCIGQGSYDDNLNDDGYKYLSLRDASGKPHVTLEIERKDIYQLQGKQNQPPIKKYMDVLIPYLKTNKYMCDLPASKIGHVIDDYGNWHHFNKIPENSEFSYEIDLSGLPLEALPSGLIFYDDLHLSSLNINELPKGLEVHGSLYLDGTNITELPEDLDVVESIDISNTNIPYIPKLKNTIQTLNANGSEIVSFADDFEVTMNLMLENTKKLQILPNNIHIKGLLYLKGSGISNLPSGMNTNSLDISNCLNLKEVPNDLLTSELLMNKTQIKKIPSDNLKYKRIEATQSELEELPDNLCVDDWITLNYNKKIKKLPKKLSTDSLCIEYTNIGMLPDDINVKSLYMSNTKIETIPNTVNNNYFIINARNSKLMNLPDNLNVTKLDLENNKEIYQLPKQLRVKSLDISGTNISELPEDLEADVVIIDHYQIDNISDKLINSNMKFNIKDDVMTVKQYVLENEYRKNKQNRIIY